MKWLRYQDKFQVWVTHAVQSDCENYRVAKYSLFGEWKYLVWRKKDKTWEQIGDYHNSLEAANDYILGLRTDKIRA